MPLLIQKGSYSAAPWRLILQRGDDIRELPDSGCARKRDLLPFYRQLLAIGDWEAFATWDVAQQQRVQDILITMPIRQQRAAYLQREANWERERQEHLAQAQRALAPMHHDARRQTSARSRGLGPATLLFPIGMQQSQDD